MVKKRMPHVVSSYLPPVLNMCRLKDEGSDVWERCATETWQVKSDEELTVYQ